jgi:hypothetical protein
MAAVLSIPPDGLVLEPSMYAHTLSRPRKPSMAHAGEGAVATRAQGEEEQTGLARYSYVGGNFGIPHRDHSSTDCFCAHAISSPPGIAQVELHLVVNIESRADSV